MQLGCESTSLLLYKFVVVRHYVEHTDKYFLQKNKNISNAGNLQQELMYYMLKYNRAMPVNKQ